MNTTIKFMVNGQAQTVSTDPERPLLEVLREDLHLTGTKYGCGEGQCSACTVLVNGRHTHACLTPIREVANQRVQTIEGLANGEKLHPVQEAFLAANAMQCGYCTPGMIMSLTGMLQENPQATDQEVLERMQGHLCRCCGYPRIVQAVKQAVAVTRR